MKADSNFCQQQKSKRADQGENRSVFRILPVVFLILIWVFLICLCTIGFWQAFETQSALPAVEKEEEPIQFANVDWGENIYQNERYLERDRQVYFGTQYNYRAITMETAPQYGAYAEFFYQYFRSIIEGDVASYTACFTEEYQQSGVLPESFTMQMLFDMYALEYGDNTEIDENGNEIHFKDFIVEYKILENNGTFRNDLKSSSAKKEYYRLIVDEEGEIRIHTIAQLQLKDEQVQTQTPDSGVDTEQAVLFGCAVLLLLAIPVGVAIVLKQKHKTKGK